MKNTNYRMIKIKIKNQETYSSIYNPISCTVVPLHPPTSFIIPASRKPVAGNSWPTIVCFQFYTNIT
jgi:hypothetical protein